MGAKLTSKITDHLKQKETFNRGFIPIFCDQKKKKKKKKRSKATRASNRIKEAPIIAHESYQKPTNPISAKPNTKKTNNIYRQEQRKQISERGGDALFLGSLNVLP